MAHDFHQRIADRRSHLVMVRIPLTPQSTRRSIETNSPILDASELAAGGIVLKENKICTPPSPSPSSSDSGDTSFSTLKQRVLAMAQSVPPRQQVSDDGSTYTSDDTHGVCEDEPEVSHPNGNASPDAQPACIDSSCTALICAGSASAVGSAVFGTEGAPAELSSSTSSTNSSSSSSSSTSRSRSTRGKNSVAAVHDSAV